MAVTDLSASSHHTLTDCVTPASDTRVPVCKAEATPAGLTMPSGAGQSRGTRTGEPFGF